MSDNLSEKQAIILDALLHDVGKFSIMYLTIK